LPIGAFVEPDEKRLAKTEKVAQTRVLVAGSSANLFASIIFLSLYSFFSILTSKAGWDAVPVLSFVIHFISMILGMAFALNFVVGSVNLLPLPFFDGYKILDINVENKNLVKGVMILTLIAFLVNFLPWFFAK
jgi:membrane-associated protease RseP (regulator of RpoE activity)